MLFRSDERCLALREMPGRQSAEVECTDVYGKGREGTARLEIVERIAVDQDEVIGVQLQAALLEVHAAVPFLDEENLGDFMMRFERAERCCAVEILNGFQVGPSAHLESRLFRAAKW